MERKRERPNTKVLLWLCPHFPNQNILTVIEFGRPTLPNLGGDPIEKLVSKIPMMKIPNTLYVDIGRSRSSVSSKLPWSQRQRDHPPETPRVTAPIEIPGPRHMPTVPPIL